MPPPDYSTSFQRKLDQISHFRRELQVSVNMQTSMILQQGALLQVEYHAEYERALVDVKEDLRETEGPDLTENMKGEIREWFNKEK